MDVSTKSNSAKCAMCRRFIRKIGGSTKIVRTEEDVKAVFAVIKEKVSINAQICDQCRRKLPSNRKALGEINATPHTTQKQQARLDQNIVLCDVPEPRSFRSKNSSLKTGGEGSVEKPTKNLSLDLPFPRVVATHRYCFICRRTTDLKVIPLEARMQVFTMKGLYVPKSNRCCRTHIIKNRLYAAALATLQPYSNTSTVDLGEITRYMTALSDMSDKSFHQSVADCSMSERQLYAFTGFTWDNVIEVREMLISMRDSGTRTITQALVIFLFRMRTANSTEVTANIFGLGEQRQVSHWCTQILQAFAKDVLPLKFGVNACSRENLITEHTTRIVNILHNVEDHLALICDGTYLRHEKSANNEYQRKSYSGQKKVHLCKPFTICTTDGYVVDLPGPFEATQNDATILKIVLTDPNGVAKLLRSGDVFILDRGFRDVKAYLENQGFIVLMPALRGKRSQLPTAEANESRFVTKCRWPVEAIHGILSKKYKLLHTQFQNKMLRDAGTYCKIACFLNNLFGKRLNSDSDKEDEIINRMQSMRTKENLLAARVEVEKFARRKVPFRQLTSADLLDFPELTEHELIVFFTGTYQLSQATSYLAEILDAATNTLKVQFLKENTPSNTLVKFEVQSRHVNRKRYRCYIQYVPQCNSLDGIEQYYCECANGSRTVGSCAHVAALIYYLSNLRFTDNIVKPAEVLTRLFHHEAVDAVIPSDSEEDD